MADGEVFTAATGQGLVVSTSTICPGYVCTPLAEAQIKDQAKAHGLSEDQVVREADPGLPAQQAVRDARRVGQLDGVSMLTCGRLSHRDCLPDRWRLDCALMRRMSRQRACPGRRSV